MKHDCYFAGRGIKSLKTFKKGDFLLQYGGKIISELEGEKLEETDSSGFRYFFKFNSKGVW